MRRGLGAALAALVTMLCAAGAAGAQSPSDLAQHSLRGAVTDENFYFVMADRFENGDRSNDRGGLQGGRLETGYDPTARGFYHGGDLRGLRQRLDYIKGLGTTAIWLTPSFKNKPVQGLGTEFVSAGYHGYWITDFTQIDPHLGTNEDLEALIDAAHAKGMKVFFDIITNHTADVIDYAEGEYDYVPTSEEPYRDAAGNVFDLRSVAGAADFPQLDPTVSFPYTPVFASEADREAKTPAWLNDPLLYHNRGNSTFAGESTEWGDFAGLDDLMTEHPRVVEGMTEIYRTWVRDFGVDGFRIDTARHVNTEFWQSFIPDVLAEARAAGKDEFLAFGEVYATNVPYLSSFTTEARFQSVIDFAFQQAAQNFAASSAPTTGLEQLFVNDDWYTDADSNVYQAPTFLGNHDMGRIGRFIAVDPNNADAREAELLRRDRLAHELMYFARGMPVIYYGDEQGFTGDGNDQLARQDMFESQVAEYNDDDLLGTDATTAESNFDRSHPIYGLIGRLAAVVRANPTLRDGAQTHRVSSPSAGVYAFSRTDRRKQVEYVVALNNAEEARTAEIPTFSAGMPFRRVWGSGPERLRSGLDRGLEVEVPGLSAVVYRATRRIPFSEAAPPVALADVDAFRDRVPVTAQVDGTSFYEVTFAARPAGSGDAWTRLGTDDNAPFRIVYDARGLQPGTQVELAAVVRDNAGHVSSTTRTYTVAQPRERLTTATIRLRRPDGDYGSGPTAWGLHLWGDALAEGVATDWDAPRLPDRIEDGEAVWEIPLADDEQPLNFIVHTPSGDDVPETREPGGDRSFVPAQSPEIWLRAGDPTIYTSPPPASR